MAQLKSPLSKVTSVLRVRSEGLGVRATARVFAIHKNTVTDWEGRFAEQKAPLMLYAVCHAFIGPTFEGDERYTVVGERGEASQSEGWTAVVMERASRFIVEQRCGAKDAQLFESVTSTVAAYRCSISMGYPRLHSLIATTIRSSLRASRNRSSVAALS